MARLVVRITNPFTGEPEKLLASVKAYAVLGARLSRWWRETAYGTVRVYYPWLRTKELPVRKASSTEYVIDASDARHLLLELVFDRPRSKARDHWLILVEPSDSTTSIGWPELPFNMTIDGARVLAIAAAGEPNGLTPSLWFFNGKLQHVYIEEAMRKRGWAYSRSSRAKAAHNLLAAWYILRYGKPNTRISH